MPFLLFCPGPWPVSRTACTLLLLHHHLSANLGAFPTLSPHLALLPNLSPGPLAQQAQGLSNFPMQPQHFSSITRNLPLPFPERTIYHFLAGQYVISTSEMLSYRVDVKSELERGQSVEREVTELVSPHGGALVAFSSQHRGATPFHPSALISLSLLRLIPFKCLHARFPDVFNAPRGLALPLPFPSKACLVTLPHFLPNLAHFMSTPTPTQGLHNNNHHIPSPGVEPYHT